MSAPNASGSTAGAPGETVLAGSREQLGVESRSAPRVPAAGVPSITSMRISPHGGDCVLVNISATGLLADCGERMQTGSSVTMTFEGGFLPRSIQGKVTRSSVSSMAQGRLRYHVGIAFNTCINLEVEEGLELGAGGAGKDAVKPEVAVVAAPPEPAAVSNRW